MPDTSKVVEADGLAGLVARVAAWDSTAEEELYARYRRGVAVILNQATSGHPAAPDLAQETFLIVFQKIRKGELREPEKLASFIWGVAHNLAIDYFRKRNNRGMDSVEEAEEIADDAPGPLDNLLSEELSAIARSIIDRLGSKRDREILFRFYVDEEEKESICADLGLTGLQFNLVLFRARKQYKKLYQKTAAKGII